MLDASKKQEVHYAVPLWQRDEQIKHSIKRVKGRIQPSEDRIEEPIAIVGYGPSLNDTWEKIKDFKYVMSCSGSHKFLIEKGIIPTYHAEVDPRPHKIGLLGEADKRVIYLPSSTCCPEYFEHLAKGLGDSFDTNVLLWHVFDATQEGLRVLPRGEWAVTGGCDIGLRCLTLAAFLGFRDLHVFGIDGCAPQADAIRHAGEHPNGKPKYSECEYDGKIYYTTPGMLEAARQVAHELKQMPAVHATFYGEGLTQAMAAKHETNPAEPEKMADMIGYSKPELISAGYKEQNELLHLQNLAYGVGGGRHAPVVEKLSKALDTTSVLDYGCGKGYLAKALAFPIWEYDPAIPEKAEAPRPADIVVCTDVLEHIEPDKLDAVLDDLRRCMKRVGYFVIHTAAAGKTLPDGRNTHLIQRKERWWKDRLTKYFQVGQIKKKGKELHVVLGVK